MDKINKNCDYNYLNFGERNVYCIFLKEQNTNGNFVFKCCICEV